MRNLVLFLIAFIAVVTFIRAFDKDGDVPAYAPQAVIEAKFGN